MAYHYRRSPIQLTSDFSSQTVESWGQQNDIINVLKNRGFCIAQNYPSNAKVKQKRSQINKGENSLLADLSYKKY